MPFFVVLVINCSTKSMVVQLLFTVGVNSPCHVKKLTLFKIALQSVKCKYRVLLVSVPLKLPKWDLYFCLCNELTIIESWQEGRQCGDECPCASICTEHCLRDCVHVGCGISGWPYSRFTLLQKEGQDKSHPGWQGQIFFRLSVLSAVIPPPPRSHQCELGALWSLLRGVEYKQCQENGC